ncbi:MAG: dihydrodipicolinate synthase family protein [Pirellulales bacterium]|nr:dihydrodipicolinate synthase family protein [Pirellulales bacterium]
MAIRTISEQALSGVWSASPTPFTAKMEVDTVAVRKMIDHHIRMGVKGLFLAGTCGEGPWMTDAQKSLLIRTASQHVAKLAAKDPAKRPELAVQVTDNSAARVLDNIKRVADDGADIAVIASPNFFMDPSVKRMTKLYVEAAAKSPLPVGIYDRGKHSPVPIPSGVFEEVVQNNKVCLVKDSTCDPERMKLFLSLRRKHSHFKLFTGSEFDCMDYLKADYDGLMLGGAIISGLMANQMIDAYKAGDIALAEKIEQRQQRVSYAAYGGKKIKCWLTGLKHLLVAMKVFRTPKTYFEQPYTADVAKGIERLMQKDLDVLLP